MGDLLFPYSCHLLLLCWLLRERQSVHQIAFAFAFAHVFALQGKLPLPLPAPLELCFRHMPG